MTDARLAPDHPDAVVGGELRLPRPPGVIRRFWARHPRLVDGLIAGIYGVPTLVNTVITALQYGLPVPLVIVTVAAVLAAALALLLFRRSHPWLVLAMAWLACLVSAPSGSIDALAMVLALYALAVYGSTRASWLGFGGSVAVASSSAYAVTVLGNTLVEPFDADPLATSFGLAVVLLLATLFGVNVGNRRRYLGALIARAQDLARERDQQAQLAAAIERSRIAREMHDIVSHGLTVMITLAEGSAATAERDPSRAAAAMRSVADAGRDALGEMRRMLGVLTDPSEVAADLAPQPDVAAIPGLVEGFREAGLPVRLTTAGPAITEPALQLAVYRLVQEGLTNALRHAAGAQHVEVRIERSGEAVNVSIEDDARHPSTAMPGAGRGLAGLRERVALYGGTLDAGPRPGGGWRLQATLHAASDRTEGDA
ncbi:sensor histidine kinase [Agromyces bauzanensis]